MQNLPAKTEEDTWGSISSVNGSITVPLIKVAYSRDCVYSLEFVPVLPPGGKLLRHAISLPRLTPTRRDQMGYFYTDTIKTTAIPPLS